MKVIWLRTAGLTCRKDFGFVFKKTDCSRKVNRERSSDGDVRGGAKLV